MLLLPKRRWAQFSLGTLFLVVTALCIALGVWAARAERQQRAVAAIEAVGGKVEYAEPGVSGYRHFVKTLLRRWLPRHYIDEVQAVWFAMSATGEISAGREGVTDEELRPLRHLKTLEFASVSSSRLGDAGIEVIAELARLRELRLDAPRLTDGALKHLSRLRHLRFLTIEAALLTDAAIEPLVGMRQLEVLSISSPSITERGLLKLTSLPGLSTLFIRSDNITPEAERRLEAAFPRCDLIVSGTTMHLIESGPSGHSIMSHEVPP